jgi:hypothetical protein
LVTAVLSGNVIASAAAAADSVRLVQKEFLVAQRRLGILINRDNDRLDVMETRNRRPLAASKKGQP